MFMDLVYIKVKILLDLETLVFFFFFSSKHWCPVIWKVTCNGQYFKLVIFNAL